MDVLEVSWYPVAEETRQQNSKGKARSGYDRFVFCYVHSARPLIKYTTGNIEATATADMAPVKTVVKRPGSGEKSYCHECRLSKLNCDFFKPGAKYCKDCSKKPAILTQQNWQTDNTTQASRRSETEQSITEQHHNKKRGRRRVNPSDPKWVEIDARRAEAQRAKESQEVPNWTTRTGVVTTYPYTNSSTTSRDVGAMDDPDGSVFQGAYPRNEDLTAPAHSTRKRQCRRVIIDDEEDDTQDSNLRNLNLNGDKDRGRAKGINPKAPAKRTKRSKKLKDTHMPSTA